MLHGEATASDVADITGVALTPEQLAAQEALMAEQEETQARLLLDQYNENKEIVDELQSQEQMAKQHISEQLDEQKRKVHIF